MSRCEQFLLLASRGFAFGSGEATPTDLTFYEAPTSVSPNSASNVEFSKHLTEAFA